MRVLLDEQLPRQLVPSLIGHEVRTVQQESWAGLKFQQNIAKRRLGVVVLKASSNAIEDLLPLVPGILSALADLRAGSVSRVEA